MLILYTGGNTSFNGFPYLASFVAGDQFLPRPADPARPPAGLLQRDPRAGGGRPGARARLQGTGQRPGGPLRHRRVHRLHHGRGGHGEAPPGRTRRGHWRRSVAINGFSAFLSFTVVLIFAVAKFKEGAWLIFVVGPLLYLGLIRLHAQYAREDDMLESGVVEATEAPVLRRHVVVVLVDRLDMATARALQYAADPGTRRPAGRPLRHRHQGRPRARAGVGPARPDPPAARHHRVPGPPARAGRHRAGGRRHPRRRHRVHGPAARAAATRRVWQRFLHDRTADKIAAVLGQVPHVSATIVPFDVGGRFGERVRSYGRSVQRARRPSAAEDGSAPGDPEGRTGVDRMGRRDGPRRPTRGAGGRRDAGPARRGHHADRRGARRASGSGWPAASSRSGCSPGRGRRISSAC